MKPTLKTIHKLKRMSDKAYRLAQGRDYEACGTVVLAPVHTDEFVPSAKVGRMQAVENPCFEVLEVRPRNANRLPWYRVRLRTGEVGWFNCVGLIGKSIKTVK